MGTTQRYSIWHYITTLCEVSILASPAPEAIVGGTAVASGLVAGSFLGVPDITLLTGMLACSVGVFGRAAFDVQRTVASKDPVAWQQIAKWSFAGVCGAPMAAVMVTIALQMTTGAVNDDYFGAALLLLGFGGQNILAPIYQLISKLASMKLGVTIPDNLNNDGDKK